MKVHRTSQPARVSLLALILIWSFGLLAPVMVSAQSVGAGSSAVAPVPRSGLNQFFQQMANITQAYDQQQAYEHALAKAYLEVPQNFHPDRIELHNRQLWMGAFAEHYNVDTSGLWSIGATGPPDLSSYTVVHSSQGGSAQILQLSLWTIDPAQYGIVLPTPVGMTIECFIHAARFGPTEPHVGYTIRFDDGFKSMLIFVPLSNVPDAGLITADNAAHFLAFVGTDGLASQTFLDWAIDEDLPMTGGGQTPTNSPTLFSKSETAGNQESLTWCDIDALKECLTEASATYAQDLADAHADHQNRINEILKEFGDDAKGALGGYLVTGGVGGALVGAPGGPVSSACCALIGLIAGGAGWLWDTATGADQAQEAVDAADAAYERARCEAVNKVADAWKECFAEHCPELYEAASKEIDQSVADSGCK